MATQNQVLPGVSIFRQTGGTAGTQEIQVFHDGTNGTIHSMSGDLLLQRGGSSRTLTIGTAAWLPDSSNNTSLGSAGFYFNTAYVSNIQSQTDLNLGSTISISGGGHNMNLAAGAAQAGSNGSGGNITLSPGARDGTGAIGLIQLTGLVVANTLQTSTIQNGTAGTVSLYADAGANNITIGGTASTLVVAGNLTVNGTTTTINSTTLVVDAEAVVVNHGGSTSSAQHSGINIEGDSAAIVGYLRSATDNTKLEFKAPAASGILTLSISATSTLTMGASLNVTGASTINQDVSTTASPSFVTVTGTTSLVAPTLSRGTAGSASVFTDAGANTVSIGGSSSTIAITGTASIANLTYTGVALAVNSNGSTAGAVHSGINILGDSNAVVGYFRSATTNSNLEMKAPGAAGILTVTIGSTSTLSISNNLTVSGVSTINQDVSTAGTPSFVTASLTGTGTNAITGSVVVGSPTGGSQGAGTLNATGVYVNGTAISVLTPSLSDISSISPTLNLVIVGDGTHFVGQSGDTARHSLGLGTADSPSFTTITSTGTGTNAITGSVVVGSPTGGSQGAGTINATGLFVNGSAIISTLGTNLTDIAGLTQAANNIIVSNGTHYVSQSGDTARHSLGLGTADTVTFTAAKISSDATAKAQGSFYTSRNTTTTATVTELFVDGTSTRLALPVNTTWAYDIIVAARRTDAAGEAARFNITGCISMDGSAATATLIGDNVTSTSEVDSAWVVTATADTTNGALKLQVTGEASKTIKWVAFVRTSEATN